MENPNTFDPTGVLQWLGIILACGGLLAFWLTSKESGSWWRWPARILLWGCVCALSGSMLKSADVEFGTIATVIGLWLLVGVHIYFVHGRDEKNPLAWYALITLLVVIIATLIRFDMNVLVILALICGVIGVVGELFARDDAWFPQRFTLWGIMLFCAFAACAHPHILWFALVWIGGIIHIVALEWKQRGGVGTFAGNKALGLVSIIIVLITTLQYFEKINLPGLSAS